MEKRFKVKLNGVEQGRIFGSDELGRAISDWAEFAGGSFAIEIEEYVPPQPSNEFQVGAEYYARSAYDHNCVYRIKVKKRTEKSIWFDSSMGNGYSDRRCVVKKDSEGIEYVTPESYSFAPVFRANKVADGVHDLADWEC